MSCPPSAHYAHASDGHIEPTSDFPFDEIYERDEMDRVRGSRSSPLRDDVEDPLTPEEMEAALRVFTKLLEWVWQNGAKNCEGLKIRAIIACWIFLKHLRPLSLTEIARGFGKKKQSLGRWVDDFKIAFPNIRNPHMK